MRGRAYGLRVGRLLTRPPRAASHRVDAEAAEDDDEAFNERTEGLTAQLAEQMAKGAELDVVIREQLGGTGYAV